MLRSQFDDLQEPARAIIVDCALEPEQIIELIMEGLMENTPTPNEGYTLGIMGLGVMGRSLALNFARHGYRVIGYDPHPRLPDDFAVATAPGQTLSRSYDLVTTHEGKYTLLVAALGGVSGQYHVTTGLFPTGAPTNEELAQCTANLTQATTDLARWMPRHLPPQAARSDRAAR